MNILITGGAGYLGGAVTDLLAGSSDHDILVYDSLVYERDYRKAVPFIYGDIRDTNKMHKYLEWADVVIWLAALVGDQACALNKDIAKEINTDTIQWLINNFNGRIIFISSCSVYGASNTLLDEKSEVNPLSHYAQTKLWAEEILSEYPNSLIFRLGTLFGISDQFARIRADLVLNTLVMHASIYNKIHIFGGRQYRPLIHVRDVARTIINSIKSNMTGIYNIHSNNVTIRELGDLIATYYHDLEMIITNTKFEDNRNYRVSSSKAKKDLGFCPHITMDEGIKELKELLESTRLKNPLASNYINFKHLSEVGIR